ncbi:MAG TPA: hypothetical protein VGH90_13180 [Chthoniobacteraceae bacterium]|jgi:hypothetical protein
MRLLVSSTLALAVLCAASFSQDTAPGKAEKGSNPIAAPAKNDGKPAKKPAATPAPAASGSKPATLVAANKSSVEKPSSEKPGSEPAAASATPAPHKPSLFGRIFGGKKSATPAPKATPVATPTPVIATHVRRPRKPVESGEQAKSGENGASEKTPTAPDKADGSEKPAGTENQANPEEKTTAQATPAPGKRRGRKGAAEEKTKDQSPAVQQAIASGDPDAIEKAKYDDLKTHAADDAHVKELKQKADTAPNEDEGRKASRAYYKALFEKMRSLDDGSAHERIERMETAVMKDLGG